MRGLETAVLNRLLAAGHVAADDDEVTADDETWTQLRLYLLATDDQGALYTVDEVVSRFWIAPDGELHMNADATRLRIIEAGPAS